jgi:putative oxidoreductase
MTSISRERSPYLAWLLLAQGPAAVILSRILIAGVFIPEGIKKFIFPDQWGAGRFEKIGIPSPEFMAHFVGFFEFSCGLFILLGLLTRLACIPLLTVMSVAIVTTKIPLLWQATVVSTHVGFWSMQAEGRTDFSQFMTLLFLFVVGGGVWSLDARFFRDKFEMERT